MDSLISVYKNRVLAERTAKKYRGVTEKCLAWLYDEEDEVRSMQKEANNIQIRGEQLVKYLSHISQFTSGENLDGIGRIILNMLAPILSSESEEYVRQNIRVLRRDANTRSPPIRKAAEPLSLKDLETLVLFARNNRLGHVERQAVNVMVVAFATISRVAEIVSLKVEDVTQDGNFISIRSKTHASTWTKQTKRVTDAGVLEPTLILRRARRKAILANRSHLFFNNVNQSNIETINVTNALKGLTRKMGWRKRITAHSARRGAAVEALMAGIPPLIIQSWGAWSDINTMQIYIGEAAREQYGLLQLLKAKRGEIGWRSWDNNISNCRY